MKFFIRRKVLIFVAILCTAASITSCDGAAWAQILFPVIQEILKPGGYQNRMQFSGTARMEMYNYNSENNTYDKDSRRTANVQTMVTISYNDTICQIQASDLSVGGQQVNQLDFVTYFDRNTMTISKDEDYLTGGLCTYNGSPKTSLDAACFSGRVVNESLTLNTIYFTIGNKLFKGAFQGHQLEQ